MAYLTPMNRADVKPGSSDVLKERMLKFRKLKKENFRLYFQVKGNENYKVPSTGKGSLQIRDYLENNNYPVNESDSDYWVPIAIGASKKKNPNLKSAKIKLSPVFPVAFSEPEGKKLMHCREGYIYIFMNGYLWRELYVAGVKWEVNYVPQYEVELNTYTNVERTTLPINSWKIYDVNLALHQGKNIRKHMNEMGALVGAVVIPYKVGNHKPLIQICFSETQWSWDYICRMGGMDEVHDPRYIKELHYGKTYLNTRDMNLINSRLQKIDLDSYDGTDKSESELRKSYLMPIGQAYDENHMFESTILEPNSKANKYRQDNFPSGRKFLSYIYPFQYKEDIGEVKTTSVSVVIDAKKRRSDLADDYIESTVPVVALLDPLGVAENLRFRFAKTYEKWQKNIKTKGYEVSVARYVEQIYEQEYRQDLDKDLNNPNYTNNARIPYYQAGDIRTNYDHANEQSELKFQKEVQVILKYLGQEKLLKGKNLKPNSVAAALLDFETFDAYTNRDKEEKAIDAGQKWLGFLDGISYCKAGDKFFKDELKDKNSISNTLFTNSIITKWIKGKIKEDLAKYGHVKFLANEDKYAKLSADNGSITEKALYDEYIKDADTFGARKSGKVLAYLGRQLRLFMKAIAGAGVSPSRIFPWDDFDNLLRKYYGLGATLKQLSMEEWLKLLHSHELDIKNIHGHSSRNIFKIAKRYGPPHDVLIKKIKGKNVKVNIIELKWLKKAANSWAESKYIKALNLYPVVSSLQVFDLYLKYELLLKQNVKDQYFYGKIAEIAFSTLQYGLLAGETYASMRQTKASANVRKIAAKGGKYRKTHNAALKSSIGEAKKFGKLAIKLAKLGGPISVLVDVSSAYASVSRAIQLSDDGHSDLATLYTTSAMVSGGAVLGGVLLAAPYLISAAAGIGMIPVLGWAIVILSVFIGAVILVLIGNATLTPTQLWLKHCYWGKEPYA
ncbi:hypothetical protein MNBD_GAMMA12-2386, partial [hydrothermal vent metagenome]